MKTNEPTYTNVLLRMLSELETLERANKKSYLQIRKLSQAPELAKALHAEQTGINDHLRRLKLISTEINKAKVKKHKSINKLLSLDHDRKKGSERDLWLISRAQQFLYQKISLYKIAHRIALHLELTHSPVLFEQTIKENEATVTWLDRTAQRILNNECIIPEGSYKE